MKKTSNKKAESTEEALSQVFKDNFVAYYRSHVAHVNIVGRNFVSFHNLLGGIYEELQSQIDVIGELMRTLEAFMPSSLEYVVDHSHLSNEELSGTGMELLEAVYEDLEHLIDCYGHLNRCAIDDGHDEIANYAQERILSLKNIVGCLDQHLKIKLVHLLLVQLVVIVVFYKHNFL